MRLKELQLYGFKSFPAKTKVLLGDGITAILGPNGCGKTNIFDALRWVLGEQGFSVLRCGKNEDLIFAGAKDMLPLGYTEIALILENDGTMPEFGSEIEIKRRYYKSGESEYLLNRRPCKLRDIQDLFLNSGAGAQAYTIFDQVRQREIVAGKVRPMFEEAAAMSKYRDRKDQTERKLELTEADLLRLDDIIRERERITKGLRRQARQLEAFNKVKHEFDQIQLSLLKNRFLETRARLQELRSRLDFLESEEKRLVMTSTGQDKRLQELKSVLKELREQHDRLVAGQERLGFMKREEERLTAEEKELLAKFTPVKRLHADREQALALLFAEVEAARAALTDEQTGLRSEEENLSARRQELAGAEQTLKALFDKLAQSGSKTATLEAKVENLKDSRAQLAAEEEEAGRRENRLREDRRGLEQRLAAKNADLAADEKTLADNRTEASRREEERNRALATKADLERRTGALKNEIGLLRLKLEEAKPPPLANKLGFVFEFLKVEPGWELAVESSLYPFIDFIVLTDGALDVAQLDRARRFGFVFGKGRSETVPPIPDHLERLASHVECGPSTPGFISAIIDRVAVVNRYDDALRLGPDHPRLIFATREGAALFPDGFAVTEAVDAGHLSLRRRLDDGTGELERLCAEIHAADDSLAGLDRSLRDLAGRQATLTQHLVGLIRERSELEGVVASVLRSVEETERNRKRLTAELANGRTQLAALESELGRFTAERTALETDRQAASDRIAILETELRMYETMVNNRLADSNSRLLTLAQLEERKHALETEIGYLVRDESVTEKALSAVGQALGRFKAERTALEADLAASGAGAGGTFPELTAESETLETELANNRTALDRVRDELVEYRVQCYEQEAECKRMEKEAADAYQADLAKFEITFEGDLNDRLGILGHRLELIGRANPFAGEEFKREKEELDRLETQRADVIAAKENLAKTIAEIDERVKDQFLSTFTSVRAAFQGLFIELFGAGEADLRLADPSNIWESEIEIVARPRGKNLKRIEQLSDGEKALLAICLLFAFYRVRPAPFCFIDEIDAPLDDANVVRFSNFLKELSQHTQIIIITHNQVTVEHADILYGVTMEKPGVSKIVSVRLKDFKGALAPA